MPSNTSIGRPSGLAARLQHERRHGGDQDGLGDPGRSVAADVARDLAAAGRVTHQGDVVEVEGLDKGREIVGIAVHVVARRAWLDRPWPRRSCAMARKPFCDEEQHLPVPRVGVQRPAVGERDGGTLAPVLVVDLGAVLRGDGAHDSAPLRGCELRGALWRRRTTDRVRRTP